MSKAILIHAITLSLFLAAPLFAETAVELDDAHAEPGLSYGTVPELPLPKTLLFSIGPDDVAADAAAWKQRGVQGFFLEGVAGEWSSDIWATDGEAWSIGASDKTFQKVQKAAEACRAVGSELFLKVVFAHPFEWFNDVQAQQAVHNFRQFAIFARDAGCDGIAMDIEYIGQQYEFAWEGYDYQGYTRADLVKKVRARATALAAALYDEFPDMIFLILPEEGFNLGSHIHAAWIEEAARRGAPGGVHYCSEGTYRAPNARYLFGTLWTDQELFRRILSRKAQAYWAEKCSMCAGVWPFGTGPDTMYVPGMPLEEFRQECAAALSVSPRYSWIYADHAVHQLIGRKLEVYEGKIDIQPWLDIIVTREVIATPDYVAIARDLRAGRARDYSALRVLPVPTFRAPVAAPFVWLAPAERFTAAELEQRWKLGEVYYKGREIDVPLAFGIQTKWSILGPFPGGQDFAGHTTVYPPEQQIDLDAEYDGSTGKIRWREHEAKTPLGSVELSTLFTPTDRAVAYAACYVTAPSERPIQIRLGTNDYAKLWLRGKLVYDYPHEGMAFLDRDVIEATLPKGTSPILLKITNGIYSWDFVLRITDEQGRSMGDLCFSATPPDIPDRIALSP